MRSSNRPIGSPKGRFRPRIETLEDRTLLDCSATFAGGVVTVDGTNKDDVIYIDDFGNAVGVGTPQFTVFCDGVQRLQVDARQVTAVTINARGGDDTVVYKVGFLDGTFAGSATRNVTVSLGKGNDSYGSNTSFLFNATYNATVSGDAGNDLLAYVFAGAAGTSTVNATLAGGSGKDRILADAFTGSSFGNNIDDPTTVSLRLDGGKDDDLISTMANLHLDGKFFLTEDGGSGNDRINNNLVLAMDSGVGEAVPPVFTVSKLGGKGKDRFNSFVNNLSAAMITTSVTLDGGPDKDTCVTGGNVPQTLISC